MNFDTYAVGAKITYLLAFFASWIYCVFEYGFLLGLGLGWLPSIFVATAAAVAWPLIALAIFVGLFFIVYK